MLNLPMNAKSLAPESNRRFGSAPLGFMILSCHDSVIYYSFWRPNKLPYAD
jgi:hypothetical protein